MVPATIPDSKEETDLLRWVALLLRRIVLLLLWRVALGRTLVSLLRVLRTAFVVVV
jgi:hypothetical protein